MRMDERIDLSMSDLDLVPLLIQVLSYFQITTWQKFVPLMDLSSKLSVLFTIGVIFVL